MAVSHSARLAYPDATNIEAGSHRVWPATGPAPAAGGAAGLGVLLQKRGVPTGYLEAQSLKRTRGFSDPREAVGGAAVTIISGLVPIVIYRASSGKNCRLSLRPSRSTFSIGVFTLFLFVSVH